MNKHKIYLGIWEGEELYINLDDKSLAGWSLMGLRPETETNLRERARETDIEDYIEIPDYLRPYIDYRQWADNQENEWLELHDSQGEYTINGETYYLGFDMGTDLNQFLKNSHQIENYKDWCAVVKQTPLTELQFNRLFEIVQKYDYNLSENKKYNEEVYLEFLELEKELSEYPYFTDQYKEELGDLG